MPTDDRRSAAGLFAVLLLLLVAFSPWAIAGMGYNAENLRGAEDLAARLTGGAEPIHWPRHGFLELLALLPFVFATRLAGASAHEWVDRIGALLPICETAAIGTVVFLWCRREAVRPLRALLLGAGGVFGTFLWPYSAIGLETTQTLALLLTGFLAFDRNPPTLRRWLLLAAAASWALGAKSNGAFLVPAVLFALTISFRKEGSGRFTGRALRIAGTALLVGATLAVAAWTSEQFPAHQHRSATAFTRWMVDGPFAWLLNVASCFGSPNKSLFLFAPVALVPFLFWRRVFDEARAISIFAALALAGLASGSGLFFFWADETWGPRYLHSALPLLLVAIGVAWKSETLRGTRPADLLLVALLAAGAVVNFLGVAFPYGTLFDASIRSGESIESLQYEPAWNAVRFHARLFGLWREGRTGPPTERDLFAPKRHLWTARVIPPEVAPPPIDLRLLAVPLPLLLRTDPQLPPGDAWRTLRRVSFASLIAGAIVLAVVAKRVLQAERATGSTLRF